MRMSVRTTAGLFEPLAELQAHYPLRGLAVRFAQFLYTVLAPIA